jgi:FlaA1/EpsC-like NDP-sugar epimerase
MSSWFQNVSGFWSNIVARFPTGTSLALMTLGVGVSGIGAYLLRFDFSIQEVTERPVWRLLIPALAVKTFVFQRMNLFHGWWRYASLGDAFVILQATLVSGILITLFLFLAFRFEGVPRSVLVLDAGLTFLFFSGLRFVERLYRERYIPGLTLRVEGVGTLIVGAGEGGQAVVREIRKNAQLRIHMMGFVDDDPMKHGVRFQGYNVLGTLHDLETLVPAMSVKQVIVAIPGATGREMRRIVDICAELNVDIKTLPGMSDLIDGRVTVQQIRDVDVKDLLGRRTIDLDIQQLSGMLSGHSILVTGAAGSIGSELCRQIAKYNPSQLLMVDVAESPLFFLDAEMRNLSSVASSLVADIRNRYLMRSLFAQVRPQVVFHAAAYKHVSMMENNPYGAVNVNVLGTKVLADVAAEFEVETFVMISTDKAVHPTNVMGATKRCAEKYVQSLGDQHSTHFVTVRFGNVLDSVGSVIPIFRNQIREGGPVTVTHPEVTRYFMTIPEASQLVLQAGCMGLGGEIFLLDMGEPVKILYLAEELIRLSGLTPHEDIRIEFTGLKPGEKLHEELLLDDEGVTPTKHPSISVARARPENTERIKQLIDALVAIKPEAQPDDFRLRLQAVVPEYNR